MNDVIADLLQKYEIPIPARPVRVILDTDIGPDVDDVGALALLHVLADADLCQITAITHCTSSPYGVPCIDVLNRAYGRDDIPIGTLKTEGFLDQADYRLYNQYLAEHYSHRFSPNAQVPDAARLIINQLRQQPDHSVAVVAIGPLINLANCLTYEDETISRQEVLDLIRSKVHTTVIMGGSPCGLEWNFEMHPQAAQQVCAKWPGPVTFTPFEVGVNIITGRNWQGLPAEHPLVKAYQLHSPDGRSSWDLTAVWAAVLGEVPLFHMSGQGRMQVDQSGRSLFQEDDSGQHAYLLNAWDENKIARLMDAVLSVAKPG